MTEIRQQMADQEIRRMAEQRRREKEETKLAKEKVKIHDLLFRASKAQRLQQTSEIC